jgi:hypothetical protein
MAHISSIGAGIFSALSMYKTAITDPTTADTLAEHVAFYATATNIETLTNVRSFPAIGTPSNIVNVPQFGQSTSSQVQGQADAPTLEFTLNYVPSVFETSAFGTSRGNGSSYSFQFSILNAKPAAYTTAVGAGGLGSVGNTNFYWLGKVESLLVTPQLTDANQATLTLSAQSAFYGPSTVT